MSNTFKPCEPRPIRFLELWQPDDWSVKVYGIAYGRPTPRTELVEAAKAVAQEALAETAIATKHYGVGFLGVHDGRTANFVFVDWWADENELHHHVYLSPSDDPTRLVENRATGPIACVWDLRVVSFERDAWLSNVLRNARGPDLEGYLAVRLSEDA
jgi:prepilin-type processing-associated H-X9-DG protein